MNMLLSESVRAQLVCTCVSAAAGEMFGYLWMLMKHL